MKNLLTKYNVAAPRYTSYPTVPYWDKQPPTENEWYQSVIDSAEQNNEISLYVHLPFCENLCTYCGCNKRITKNHRVEEPYINAVLTEWKNYLKLFSSKPIIRTLHFGGGSPTFFQPENLERLISGLLQNAEIAPNCEFSFEAHPHTTTIEHLNVLYRMGFRRISLGVQDFSDEILQMINRKQTAAEVHEVTLEARKIGYESINYDIIYGLPTQSPKHIFETAKQIELLKPDRIAYYSYAHVPWIKPSQRAYSVADLPLGEAKRLLYETGKDLLEDLGYHEIGLDHFALETDELYKAQAEGRLHRNFMGYTPHYTRLSIGLGASAISDSWGAYIQNEKQVEAYQEKVSTQVIPFYRGHQLTSEDQIIRQHILNLMCHKETSWSTPDLRTDALYEGLDRLQTFAEDRLIELQPFFLKITPEGQPFMRNICLAFDAKYWEKKPEGKLFSQVV